MALNTTQKLEILYNKKLGIATSIDGGTIQQQPPDNALPKIYPNLQIFTKPIPVTAPTDLVLDTSFTQTQTPSKTSYRYYSTAYPWIVKYVDVQLKTEQYQKSYNGKIYSVNLLSNTIPFNYDPLLSYNISVSLYNSSGTSLTNFVSDNSTVSWNYDSDAGYITFYGSTLSTYLAYNPVMTFWRYEGGVGFPDSTNATNIVIQSDNTSGTYYVPFSKYAGSSTAQSLFVDDTTGPLTYNPSTSTLQSANIGVSSSIITQSSIIIGPTGQINGSTGTVAIGLNAGYNLQQYGAVAIGNYAGYTGQGTGSISIGNYAGSTGQGQYSVAIGNRAGATGQGNYSVAIGNNALNAGYTGSVALGYNSKNTANNQIILGTSAETVVVPGSMTANGTLSSSSNILTDGTNTMTYRPNGVNTMTSSELYFGSRNTLPSGTGNVCLGFSTGHNLSTGSNNTCIGLNSGNSISTGSGNTCIGYNAGQEERTFGNNVFVGKNAGYTYQNQYSVFIGADTGYWAYNGDGNTIIGYQSGYNLSGGLRNTFIGCQASQNVANSSLQYSTALGYQSNNANFSYSVALGSLATNTAANQIMLGTSTETVVVPGPMTVTGTITGTVTNANNATNIVLNDDNTSGPYYIPFSKSAGSGTAQQLFVDSTTGPLSYNPNTSTLSCSSINVSNVITPNNVNIGTTGSIYGLVGKVSIGTNAGYRLQGPNAIAIGNNAGYTGQGTGSIAIGNNAGATGQGQYSVAVGNNAGATGQGQYAVAIGNNAGATGQGQYSVAIGNGAGATGQGQYAVAIGNGAGATGQGNYSVAIGNNSLNAGFNNSVALGYNSKNTANNQIMLGTSTETVVVPGPMTVTGTITGTVTNANNATSIVLNDDNTSGPYYIPFSKSAGSGTAQQLFVDSTTGPLSYNPGSSTLSCSSINVSNVITPNNVNIGTIGSIYGLVGKVSIGTNAGYSLQGPNAIAIGNNAGYTGQGTGSIAIGNNAGATGQGQYSVAIGNGAGATGQGQYSVAIGNNALNGGFTGSVALGYNSKNTDNNQIMLGTSSENVVVPGKIQPSTTVAPDSFSDLGYTFTYIGNTILTITNSDVTQVFSFTIDGTKIPYGTYSMSCAITLGNLTTSGSYALWWTNTGMLRTTPTLNKLFGVNEVSSFTLTQPFSVYSGSSTYRLLLLAISPGYSATSFTSSNLNPTVWITRIA